MGDARLATLFFSIAGHRGPDLDADLEAALVALHDAGRAAWPAVELAIETFVSHVAERVAQRGGATALASLHVEDLYLAAACLHAVPSALLAFERAYLVHARGWLRRIDPSDAFAGEVEQIVRERLFVAAPGATPRIGEYEGRGDLLSWVRTVTLRIALGLRRRGAQERLADDHGEPDVVDGGHDPELGYLKAHYQDAFRRAFAEALARLDPEQRNLLRMHAIDGLGVERLGRLFGVSAATISRRLTSCRQQIGKDTRRVLRERLGLAPEELDSLAGLVRSQFDLSLSRLLTGDDAG